MNLNKRLSAVMSMVRENSRAADIGSDHAHLPVVLIQSGRCPSVIATDIIEGPVASAKRTVERTGLADRIDVRLGDGLAPVQPDEVDDILIAGMGGENIVGILRAAPWLKNKKYHLVLQPQSRPEVLREYLLTNGFDIETECSVTDHGHHYLVLSARYTNVTAVTDVYTYYVGKLTPQNDRAYLEWQLRRLTKKANGLKHDDQTQEAVEFEQIAAKLDAFLKSEETI